MTTLSDQIRAAVDASDLSRYRICKELGISEATMSRFMSHKGGLSMASLDRIGELLGLQITVSGQGRKDT